MILSIYGEPSFFDVTANVVYFVISVIILISFFILCYRVGVIRKLLIKTNETAESCIRESNIAEFRRDKTEALKWRYRALYIKMKNGETRIKDIERGDTNIGYEKQLLKSTEEYCKKIVSLGGSWPEELGGDEYVNKIHAKSKEEE